MSTKKFSTKNSYNDKFNDDNYRSVKPMKVLSREVSDEFDDIEFHSGSSNKHLMDYAVRSYSNITEE